MELLPRVIVASLAANLTLEFVRFPIDANNAFAAAVGQVSAPGYEEATPTQEGIALDLHGAELRHRRHPLADFSMSQEYWVVCGATAPIRATLCRSGRLRAVAVDRGLECAAAYPGGAVPFAVVLVRGPV